MRDSIQLAIHGELVRVSGADAFRTLSDYLRLERGLVGTKIVCAEGDCGACSVLVGRPSPDGTRFDYRAIDSCIVFMHQLDRCHVVTVEGLAASGGPLTAIQQAMVDCHGSQCGFCTPGFVVTMHGLFEERERADAPAASASNGSGSAARASAEALDDAALRLGLSGNLCRCTGYVQILDAGKSVSSAAVESMHERFPPAALLASFGALGDDAIRIAVDAVSPGESSEVFVARTLAQALDYKSQHPDARVVSGATDVGVQHNHGRLRDTRLLSLRDVPELASIRSEDGQLVIGAAATWTRVLEAVRDPFPELAHVIERFGSPQIRNIGTFGGNLANASPIADSIPFLYAIDAQLELVSGRGSRTVPIEKFYLGYKQLDLRPDELIAAVRCPEIGADRQLRLYKVSRRRDMDISTFTAAFVLTVRDGVVEDARVALGGVGPTVVRAVGAESALRGQPWCAASMRAAGAVARTEITPITDVRGSDAYRWQLAENIFERCYHDVAGTAEAVSP